MTHFLHVSPSFAPGGAQVRTAQIINSLGPSFRHTLVALDGRFETAERIDREIAVTCLPVPKHRNPMKAIALFLAMMRQQRPAALLTYNWGSMDAVVAAGLCRVCPVIHTEDGFGPEEASSQKLRRVAFRRLALTSARYVIAPSHTLRRIMTGTWGLPASKVRYIPNGIDVDRFVPAAPDTERREVTVGSVGHLRPEKCYHVLIEACAMAGRRRPLRLLLAGDGVERERLERTAQACGFRERVTFLGHQEDVRSVYRRLDIFALSSSTEQMPLSVLEAMASGLPVVCSDVGDVRQMVSAENRGQVCAPGELHTALGDLAADAGLRRDIGMANRKRAVAEYALDRMCGAYRELYRGALPA